MHVSAVAAGVRALLGMHFYILAKGRVGGGGGFSPH